MDDATDWVQQRHGLGEPMFLGEDGAWGTLDAAARFETALLAGAAPSSDGSTGGAIQAAHCGGAAHA